MIGNWVVVLGLATLLAVATSPTRADEEHSGKLKRVYAEEPLSRQKRFLTGKFYRNFKDLPAFTIGVVESAPYTYKNDNLYTGFVPDIIYRVGRMVGFRPVFKSYTAYGALVNGSWNGMIGDIIKTENNQSGGIHIAAADLTITSMREAVVDFVSPFQNLGLTVIMKKPHFDTKTMKDTTPFTWPFNFTIFAPLAPEVWALCTLFVILVGIVLWVMNKFNPYEWAGRYNIGLASEHQAESFSLAGSLWFVFTTLQWQGFERAPRSLGAKTLTVFWFGFVTIVLVTYTASLVNHLFWASMVHGQDPTEHPIKNLQDLIQNQAYSYGCVRGGSTYSYLTRGTPLVEFAVMKKYWESDEGRTKLAASVREGVAMARDDPKYGFILESLQAKYYTNQLPCDLQTIGQTFAMRSYAFALPNNSEFLDDLHAAILRLKEEGVIEALERKWWVDKGQCWNVTQVENLISQGSKLMVDQPKRVNLHMFWGPILLIICGIIISIIVMVAEVLFYKYRGRYNDSNRPQGHVLKLDADEGNI